MKRLFSRLLSAALVIAMVAALSMQLGPGKVSAKSESVTPEVMGDYGWLISVQIGTGSMDTDGQIDLTIDTGNSEFELASMQYMEGYKGLEAADTALPEYEQEMVVVANELIANGIQGLTVNVSGEEGLYIHYIKIDFIRYDITPDWNYNFRTLAEWDYYTGKYFERNSTTTYGTPDTLNYEKVTIATADESTAGTDMLVYAWLRDTQGNTSTRVCLNDCMEMEKGDVEEIYISVPQDFTEVQKLCMETWTNYSSGVGWKIASIAFERAGRTITPNVWLLEQTAYDYITFGLDPGTTSIFKHTVKTSDDSGAGTDSNIDFQFRQDVGNWTNPVRISDYDHNAGVGNGFEKDDTDVFAAAYAGEGWSNINHLQITKDNSGPGPDWKPAYVELQEIVADDAVGNTYRFDINEFIEDETVEYGDAYPGFVIRNVEQVGWKNILEQLEGGKLVVKTEDGFVLDEGVVALLKEKGITLKVEFVDGERSLGIYTIDGTKIKELKAITVSKDLVADNETSPKTGDASNNGSVYAGLLLLAGICVAVSCRRLGMSKLR